MAEEPKELTTAQAADLALECALSELKVGKPNDRSEIDRKTAIVITEIEKAQAILRGFLIGQ